MAQTRVGGGGLWLPWEPKKDINTTPLLGQVSLGSSDEKVNWIGRVWTTSRSSKSISRLGFMMGSIVTTSTSQWVLSLQDVSTSGGQPFRADGTKDQTVTISSTDATFVSETWYRTQPLSSNRSVMPGDLLAVVVEFSTATGQLGSDVLNFRNVNIGGGLDLGSAVIRSIGGTQSVQAQIPNILLEFSDGTYGTLDRSLSPISSLNSLEGFNSGTSSGLGGNERGMRFSLPFDCSVDGAFVEIFIENGTAFDLTLYSGTTVLQTVNFPVNMVNSVGIFNTGIVPFPAEQALTKNTEYILAVKPSNTNNVNLSVAGVSTNSYWQAAYGSTSFYSATRTGTAAWDLDDVRRPFMGVRVSKLEVGGSVTQASESNMSQVMFKSRGVAY